MSRPNVLFCSIAVALSASTTSNLARAKFVYNISQSGPNIVINGAGSLDLTALASEGNGIGNTPVILPSLAVLDGGSNSNSAATTEYIGISGPTLFGTGSTPLALSGTGDVVAVRDGQNISLPGNYTSRSTLSNTDIIYNNTLSGIGVTPGIYVYTWGSGPTADSLTINIGVVPEPASAALIAAPVAIAALRRRRRHLV